MILIGLLYFILISASSATSEVDVHYVFFSKSDPNGIVTNITDTQSISRTSFSNKKDTIFYIHGWLDKFDSHSCNSVKSALLEKHDINIFIVNWDKIADNILYPLVFEKVEATGKVLGNDVINFIRANDISWDKISMAGHSLGAHVAGVAGHVLEGKLDHIVGLDPAGPLYTSENTENRLTKHSARFVQAIHTCGGLFGYFKQIGHADYYPNGGRSQPMCWEGQCSHVKSVDYYVESLLTGQFKAKQCDSYKDYENGKCDEGKVSYMGEYNIDKTANGTYFLDTNKQPPYAKN
ncbi:unnamed protein product [Phyllotreta striolata]|uniref:Lipase domain-containing protein n=1 Tax=Phyllotreta striolata TaxID=444603 RepID=A0A9N9XNM8_PHYSR|nr:unnamed protein product [Phyllotreta striolata]